jgi:hypothetical protein
MVDIFRQIMSRPIESEEDIILHEAACGGLNQVILHGSFGHDALMAELFRTTLQDIEDGAAIEAENVRFAVQAHLCSNLTNLALRLGTGIAVDNLHGCVDFLCAILEHRNDLLYEEAVMALSALYLKSHELFGPDEIERLLDIVRVGLSSGAPHVINSASILLADLYRFSEEAFGEQVFREFFEIEVGLLRENELMRAIHPFVVEALARMLEGAGRTRATQEMLAQYEDPLFQVMQMVRTVTINPASRSDREYANILFEHLARLYKMFARLYWPPPLRDKRAVQLERKYVMEMSLLAEAVVRLSKVAEFTIFEFAEMAAEFGEHCSRENNVPLNRSIVHKLLEMGQREEMKMKIRDRCCVVGAFLRSK